MGKKQLTQKERIEAIKNAIASGMRTKDIAFKFHITEGRVSQIKKDRDRELNRQYPYYYVECLDHGSVENPPAMRLQPAGKLAIVGQLVKEDEDSMYLRQTWSQTTGKDLRYFIVIKSTITKLIKLIYREPKTNQLEKGGEHDFESE